MTRVKICGLRREEDIEAANQCRPDYIGFVFAESRRRVEAARALELKKRLAPGIATVGVFVNEDVHFIAVLCKVGLIELVQLHGEEDIHYIAALKKQVSVPVIKAVPVAARLPKAPRGANYTLYDTASTQRGGTGRPFNWELLRTAVPLPYFLAGGLHCGNVEQAVQTLHPFAVDVSSGVETDGTKDADKMSRFVRLVRRQNA